MVTSIKNNRLNLLARRVGYNLALRHFRVVQELAAKVADGFNLADLLIEVVQDGRLEESQLRPIVNMLLVEKFNYAVRSENLRTSVESITKLSKIVGTWTNIQVVIASINGNGDFCVLNPENIDAWENLLPFHQGSPIVCYVASLENGGDPNFLDRISSDIITLLYGGRVKTLSGCLSSKKIKQFVEKSADVGSARAEMPVPVGMADTSVAPSPPVQSVVATKQKITTKIAVNVTNELFHNGNVESWKRVIQSYKYKYPHLDVLIWYDGERINDINTLFKWGKVKHGTPIMFSVAGDSPAELVKLRKYLYEGASPRFEAFLHGSPGSVLQLF